MPMEMDTTDLMARARAGDHNAFGDLVQGHSHELQVHCYRILGSLQDAEDAVQETLVSAWRNLGEFGQRSSLRTWLYKIATNRCLDMLRADSRRPPIAPPLPEVTLPEPTGAGDPPWLDPYPDVLLDHLADQRPGPEARYETTEAISLAFITALQLLPPRQRAALVLRDVLGYHAAEVAQMLDVTQESVQSALKRARATVDNHLADSGSGSSGGTGSRRPARQPGTAAEHRLVARFTGALERADLDTLIELLAADVRLSMPPAMLEYRGIEAAQRFLAASTLRPGRTYRVVPTRANGQPAFGLYLADPHASVYRAYALLVITTAGDHITAITGFSSNVMTRFGLPRTLPESSVADVRSLVLTDADHTDFAARLHREGQASRRTQVQHHSLGADVPIGYLETVGPVALFTVAVLWPPRRPAALARVVFVLTHLLNEAPAIGWIWLLTSTGLAVTGGQLASAGGAAVAALAVFTAAGLVEVTRRGLRTSRAVDHALNHGLGPAAALVHRPSQQQQHLLRVTREVVLPLSWRPRRVRRIRNLRYGPHGRHNLLDLYLSRDRHAAPRPVLIHFHGGHFEVGVKSREALPLLHRFAAQGWLCISANYRLGPAGRFPNALIDAKQVIAWARSPAAASYRADPATLIVAGSSAGAHLAAMAALTINDPDYQPGFEHDDTTVTGAVCLYGYYGDLDTGGLLPSTPQAHVRRDAPPFMIVHGANDTLVPLPDATSFADQLASTSASPVVCLTLPGALHSFDLLHSPRFDNVIDGIDTFTAAVRAAASATPAR